MAWQVVAMGGGGFSMSDDGWRARSTGSCSA